MESDEVRTAVCSPDLVLRANRLFDDVLFQTDRFCSEPFRGGNLTLVGAQGVQQAHREGGTGAQPGAGWEVSVVLDLHPGIHFMFRQNAANRWMLDLFDGLRQLYAGVNDAVAVFEERRQVAKGNVTVLVDGSAENGTAVLVIPHWVIGPTAKERDTEGCPAHDHGCRTSEALSKVSGVPISRKRP